jgi:Fe-S-cluster containining protein
VKEQKNMVKNPPITLLGESESINDLDTDAEIICLDLEILGEPLHFRFAALDKPAKLADIVPAARVISSEISEILQKKIISNGGEIPCHKGCTLCCHYLVLLSPPEALRLLEETMHLSLKDCGDVVHDCSGMADSVRKYLFRSISPEDGDASSGQQKDFADWYFKQKKPCSFLRNNSCSIYEQRPIACREYLIVDTDTFCNFNDRNEGHLLNVPISIREALKTLTCNLDMTTMESIVLPCIFDWFNYNRELANRTWSAASMVKRFVKIVKSMEKKE